MKNRPNIFVRLFRNIFLLVNLCAVVWLALCAASAYMHPTQVKYISLFSLTTPFAIAVNVFFIFFWLFSAAHWRSLWSLATLVACYKVVLTIMGFNFFGENDMAPRPATVKVMSWNTHGMGIFNKPRDKAFDQRLLDFIKQTDADILCLPEYSLGKDDVLKPFTENIIKNGDYVDYRFKDDNSINNRAFLGTAVFSRYPFKNYESHKLADNIYMLQGDIQLPEERTIRMFFVHLTTFGLSDKDKAYIDEIKKRNTDVTEADLNKSKSFISKFNHAFEERAKEVDIARAIINQSPYPVLLCGDFNDLPGSYTYTTMRADLKDAFLEKGKGFGRTYNRILPTLRIDHIFYDPSALKLRGFKCPATDLSDHNPLIANFEIVSKPRP